MLRKTLPLLPLFLLASCGGTTPPAYQTAATQGRVSGSSYYYNDRVPDFAKRNYEPFTRQDVVAIAMREWRLFNQPVNDDDPLTRPEPSSAAVKPERAPGLWQRVGEYWWTSLPPGSPESQYTGKHNAQGQVFEFPTDGTYAWSAAFISYVMRIAGANDRFPYSPNHSTYINAAASGQSSGVRAQNPANYAPRLGDLVCVGRGRSRSVKFSDLPTSYGFPAHCGIVVATNQSGPPFGRQISVIGGNVDDAVALTHIPVDANGNVADSSGQSYDPRYPWCVVLQVMYDADSEYTQ